MAANVLESSLSCYLVLVMFKCKNVCSNWVSSLAKMDLKVTLVTLGVACVGTKLVDRNQRQAQVRAERKDGNTRQHHQEKITRGSSIHSTTY
jgi:hypothetical protein